jgi:hypothetical protein
MLKHSENKRVYRLCFSPSLKTSLATSDIRQTLDDIYSLGKNNDTSLNLPNPKPKSFLGKLLLKRGFHGSFKKQAKDIRRAFNFY